MRLRRREQGAVAVFLSLVICFVMVPLAALAVDLGSQRVARRDAQAVADTVALDMARTLGGGTTPTDAMAQARAASISGVAGSAPTVHVYTGYLGAGATFLSNQSLGCDGTTSNGYFTAPPAGTSPNAVLVTVTGSVPFSFHSGSGGVCRSSIAGIKSTACFKMGSWAARISSSGSSLLAPLNSILGVNLALADYQGLAVETVTLADLGADSHIGSVDQLLTGGVTYGNLVLAALDVVSRNDPTNTATIAALNKLATASAAVAGTVKLGQSVVSAASSDAAALEMKLNLLDILTGTALAADGSYGITASMLQVQAPGLGNVASSTLKITQAAQQGCGAPGDPAAQANSSQLSGDILIPAFQSNSVNLPGPGPTLKTQTASADLTVNVGNAAGQLADPIVCGAGTTASPHQIGVNVSSGLGTLALNGVIPATLDTSLLSLYSVHFDYKFNISAGLTSSSGSTTATLKIPPNDTTPVSTGSGFQVPSNYTVAADQANSKVTVTLLSGVPVFSGTLAAALDPATGLISTLVSSLLTTTTNAANALSTSIASTMTALIGNLNSLLGPYADALGLSVGGADLFAVKSPVCNSPVLKG